jgi:glycosyltransferase involved in cell wall biosynthesis
MPEVSVVISTFERPDKCERAIFSALSQDPSPLEILVCDDGSTDDTAERIRSLESRDPRITYIRVEPNRGTPAVARNLGCARARADLIAFLDDDDEWLPHKLAAQVALASDAELVATNALTTKGPYFALGREVQWPSRRQILQDNPVILSSALVQRGALLTAGSFPVDGWLRGVEDYAAWLAMADVGCRFAILGSPLVKYATDEFDRLSSDPARTERALARLALRRLRARPFDPLLWRAAVDRAVAAGFATRATRRKAGAASL